jgi:hypothetical protein
MSAVGDDVPRELVVDAKPAPGDASDGAGGAMAPFALPALAAGLLAKFVSPTAGLVALVASIVFLLIRRKPNEGRFVLRVSDGAVEVTRERARSAPVRIALKDLLDVRPAKETRQASGRPIERVRIALDRRSPEVPIFIPEAPLSPLEAQEWHSKVRVFLRKHGWVPEDELP